MPYPAAAISLALALLAAGVGRARGGRIAGLIVDHALRPESAAEAAATAALLGRHGCEAEILRWSEAKPRSGLQEAARMARYRLLREACRRRGVLHLLVAHHADDQDETVAMRAARQSGPDGLAGMSAAVELPEVRLLRPLLGVPGRGSPRRWSLAACRGSTILPTPIRASSGRGCASAIGRSRLPPIAAAPPAS